MKTSRPGLLPALSLVLVGTAPLTAMLVTAALPHIRLGVNLDAALPLGLAAAVGAGALAARRASPRAGIAGATAAIAASAALALVCAGPLHTPRVYARLDSPLVTAARFGFDLLALLASAAAGAAVAYLRWNAPPTRASRVGAWATLAALVGLLAGATVASTRAPDPGRYLASLPVYARLPAKSHIRPPAIDVDARACRDVIPFGDVTLVRDCGGACRATTSWCSLALVASARRGAPSPAALDAAPRSPGVLANTRELRVRLDEVRDLFLVDDGDAVVALDLRALRPVALSPRTLVPVLAPPRARLSFAAAGLALSLALLVAARRRRAPEPAPATLRPDGALVLDGRALTGVAVPPDVAPGPVVVFLARDLAAPHYRDDAPQAGARVEPGTLDDHRARVAARATRWAALAWAVAALAGAPLAAWAVTAAQALTTKRPAAPVAPPVYEIDGVRVEELAAGAGDALIAGRTVDMHYTGTVAGGAVFDSSWEHGRPFSFRYGAGQVIQGFERGMRGMRVGGRRRITIPPELGYGARGAGQRVPPDATLVFEIQLLAVR